MARIPVLLTSDLEPALRHTRLHDADAWQGLDEIFDRYAKRFEEFSAAGDELGIHAHGYRRDEAKDEWIVDHGNQPWVSTGCSHGPVIPDPSDPRPMLYPLHLMADPGIFRRVMDGLLSLMNRPYLLMVSRSGDAAQPQARANFAANTEFIATHPSVKGFAFCTPPEAVALYAT